jgi:hypothetical protein
MAQFFEKLAQESKGKNPPEFFSDHPNPDHRLERVDEEVQKLGGTPPNARRDSPEFEAAKREVMTLPVPPKKTKAGTAPFPAANAPAGPPAVPSEQMTAYQSRGFSLSYPDNWKQFGGDNTGVTFGPEGGVVNDGSGHGALAYGLTIGTVPAQGNSNDTHSLPSATQQVINSLQQSNPNMKVTRQPQEVRLNNQPALSTYVSNDSPGGGAETDWLITIMRPEGLVYFVCTVPQDDFQNYHKTFAAILDSVRFHN